MVATTKTTIRANHIGVHIIKDGPKKYLKIVDPSKYYDWLTKTKLDQLFIEVRDAHFGID